MEGVHEKVVGTDYEVKIMMGDYQGSSCFSSPAWGDHSVPHISSTIGLTLRPCINWGQTNHPTAAVGSLNFEYKPGTIVIVDQFMISPRAESYFLCW